MHTLNNWKVIHAKAPDTGRYVACVEGEVQGTNPRFPKASIIRTSHVTAYEVQGESMIVVTARGSEYRLGKPHPEEKLSQSFFKSFLPERKAPEASAFDGAQSHVIGFFSQD